MKLYKVSGPASLPEFYFAENCQEAERLYIETNDVEDEDKGEVLAEAVWANNKEQKYRGYVIQD